MLYIKNTAYKKIATKNVHEECGILAGKNNSYIKVYECLNKSREQDTFQIGWLDKIKIFLDMWKNRYDQWILYHVHKVGARMSEADIKVARLNSINIIVYNRKIKIYQILKNNTGKKCAVPMLWKVLK